MAAAVAGEEHQQHQQLHLPAVGNGPYTQLAVNTACASSSMPGQGLPAC